MSDIITSRVPKTAVLVDGAFFIKRIRILLADKDISAEHMARYIWKTSLEHLKKQKRPTHSLYRIFFYDSRPPDTTIYNPIAQKRETYSKLPESLFRIELHERLRSFRKVALRLGELDVQNSWVIHPVQTKKMLKGQIQVEDIEPKNVRPIVTQKGVDIKIGLDIASLSYQGIVDQIILISGDSDFVPAAKMARRSGIDFILDPMWNNVKSGLNEHVDGMQTTWPKPVAKKSSDPSED